MAANPNGGNLQPGADRRGCGQFGRCGVGTGPSVGGQRPRNNNFTVEGVDNNNKSVTGPVIYIPNDAVAEFTVLQNQFSAEFGTPPADNSTPSSRAEQTRFTDRFTNICRTGTWTPTIRLRLVRAS